MTAIDQDHPLVGSIKWNTPGQPVTIYRGLVEVNGYSDNGKITLVTTNGLDLRWDLKNFNGPMTDEVEIVLRRGPSKGHVIRGLVLHSDGNGIIARPQSLGTGEGIVRVVSHWFNVPVLHPLARLSEGNSRWRGRWSCVAAGWSVTLDSRYDLAEVFAATKASTRAVMTHVCELGRTDHTAFNHMEAERVLSGLQMAFSFALGRWIAPAVPFGYDRDGSQVWTQLGPWRCDSTHGHESWFDTHRADDLTDFVRLFLDAWLDPTRHDIVKYCAHHVIAANHSGTTVEGRIMLAQAGMEYLSWVTNVLTRKMSKDAYEKAFPHAHDVVRGLILGATIPTDVPAELDALSDYASSRCIDGPEAVSRVRNKLVHPKNPAAVYEIDNLVVQSWQLFMHYGDLLVLHWLGYSGSYMKRFPTAPIRSLIKRGTLGLVVPALMTRLQLTNRCEAPLVTHLR